MKLSTLFWAVIITIIAAFMLTHDFDPNDVGWKSGPSLGGD